MKIPISITLEPENIEKAEKAVYEGTFRSVSAYINQLITDK